jgi:hypothetical protein
VFFAQKRQAVALLAQILHAVLRQLCGPARIAQDEDGDDERRDADEESASADKEAANAAEKGVSHFPSLQ